MKSSKRAITEVTTLDNTCFVCECGYSSGNKSATSRHKCRNGGSVLFKCLECSKICNNPGSLKRHVNAKHKNITISVDATKGVQDESHLLTSVEVPTEKTNESEQLNIGVKPCTICDKTLKNDATLKRHMETVHKNSNGNSQNQQTLVGKNGGLSASRIRSILSETGGSQVEHFPCTICQKSLKTKKNLERHLLLVHKQSSEAIDMPANSDAEQPSAEVAAVPQQEERARRAGAGAGARRRSLSLLRHKGRRK